MPCCGAPGNWVLSIKLAGGFHNSGITSRSWCCSAAAAINALAAQEDADTADELLNRAEGHHSRDVRRAALAGLGRLAKAETTEKALKKDLREALEKRLTDPLFHARLSAIVALKLLGDPASKPALKRAHGAERFAMLRRYLREALGALGS